MGADGGTLFKRHELVAGSTNDEKSNENDHQRAWTSCKLTGDRLVDPVVSDAHGSIYNKTSILKHLLGMLPDKALGIKQIRDVVELNREFHGGSWVDCAEQKDIVGTQKTDEYAYLAECGHIAPVGSLENGSSCPACAASFTDFVVLNPRRKEAIDHNEARMKRLHANGLSHSLRPKKNSSTKRPHERKPDEAKKRKM